MEDIYTRLPHLRLGLFVPLDHRDVLCPRPPTYEYDGVRAVLDRDMREIEEFIGQLAPYIGHKALESIPRHKVRDGEPYWDNGYFSGDDARLAFAIPAFLRPTTIVEIGSGNSTLFFRKSVETFDLDTTIVSIDPKPRAKIVGVSDRVVARSVLEVPLAEFDQLGRGDILFHDGSHLTFNGTDTVRLFLEILPRLKPGVIVHIHDVCLPFEYVADFDKRGYSEQYLLAASLLFGKCWKVMAPVAYLCSRGVLKNGGVSFWMAKTNS